MIHIFENYDDAGVVGSKLVYPDGSLQEAGGIIWRDGSGWNYGRNEDPDLPEFNYVKRVDYVSGASILFRREWFSNVGRFDERFAPAYYEDTDLAFQARSSGLQVYYQPKSVIVHYEGKSHGVKENEGIKKTQWINQKKFREKWSEVLDSQHQENGKAVIRARERSEFQITVLVIDHYVPLYDQDAGSRSTFQYLELLVKAGCNVKFMGDNFYRHQPYSGQLEGMGIEVLVGDFYRKHWKRWLEENPDYVDIVYLMRPHVAEKYIDDINSLTRKPKIIYFGHDLHFLRLQRKFLLTKNKIAEKEARIWKLKEYAIFEKADVVYFPSIAEVEEILRERPSLPVKAIPLFCYDEWGPGNVDFNQREGLLFVGGFNHPPNIDGLKWFLQEIFPLVLERLPYIVLHIVGSNMPHEIRKLGSANIRIEGFLSDEELFELYDRVRLSVVPLRYGAGVKGKVLEAMKHGVPVVTTSIGAEGIPDPSGSLLTEDDPFKLGEKIAEIYEDRSLLKTHSSAGLKVIEENFSQRVVLEKIEDDFLIGGRSGK
jgi:glycosyltransferase involved in cell wall biosynthesis